MLSHRKFYQLLINLHNIPTRESKGEDYIKKDSAVGIIETFTRDFAESYDENVNLSEFLSDLEWDQILTAIDHMDTVTFGVTGVYVNKWCLVNMLFNYTDVDLESFNKKSDIDVNDVIARIFNKDFSLEKELEKDPRKRS